MNTTLHMRHLLITAAILLHTAIFTAQNEKKGNLFSDAGDAAKVAVARQKLYAGNYVGALNSFREVESRNPQNVDVKYYVGLCYYNLGQYAHAREVLQKALAIGNGVKPELHLLLAKIYHKDGEYEQALQEVRLFHSTDQDQMKEAATLMIQCENAKNMTTNPVNVAVTNLGPAVNSKYDDKNPCMTADGKTLIFTTRRPETTGAPTDVEGDGKYFENIYIAGLDSATRSFKTAAAASGAINTPAHDACTSISPDGRQIFIYRNDASSKASRGGNVFVSKVMNNSWRKPEPLGDPINSSYWEGGACVSPDGKRYFFSSERPGGHGASDIWMAERINKSEWSQPVNLGPAVNTEYDEAGMFLAPDGKTLFFCSNGPGSMGSYDVFKTVLEGGKWSQAENLGYPINSAGKEGQLTLSADARTAYLSSDRKGGIGESDLYAIDLKDYAILEKGGKRQKGNGLTILRGTVREGFEGYGMQDVNVTVTDEAGNKSSTMTNENGEYFLTTRGGKYTILLEKAGFKPISEQIEVPASEQDTRVLEKGYLMKK